MAAVERDEHLGRRLVRRTPVYWTWHFPQPPPRKRLGRKQEPAVVLVGRVVDVSVLGARVVCDPLPGVGVGDLVSFDWDGVRGALVVRRVRPAAGGTVEYGVEFAHLEPERQELVNQVVDPAHARTEDVWEQSD